MPAASAAASGPLRVDQRFSFPGERRRGTVEWVDSTAGVVAAGVKERSAAGSSSAVLAVTAGRWAPGYFKRRRRPRRRNG